jgi:PAS domain S-box-containing protein
MDQNELLSRQLTREKLARKEAEAILEHRSEELYLANQSLLQLAENLTDKEEKTRMILDATADGIVVLDDNNIITICNNAAANIFGYSSTDLIGMNLNALISDEDDISCKFIEMINGRAPASPHVLYEIKAQTKDQGLLPIEVAISKTQSNKINSTICAIRNIFVRKQADFYLAMQHKITRVLAESPTLDSALIEVFQIMCDKMQLDVGALWEASPNGILQCISIWPENNERLKQFSDASKSLQFKEGEGLPGRILKTKESSWIEDVTIETNFPRAHYALQSNLHGAIGFPVFFEGEVIAVLEFFMTRYYQFDDNLMKMIKDISNQIGIFLKNNHNRKLLYEAQRLTGMAEVATSVLHNVGNVLNSINISVSQVSQNITRSKLSTLLDLRDLLNDSGVGLSSHIEKHPKGKLLLGYLLTLYEVFEAESKKNLAELTLLMTNIRLVNDIINSQQSTGRPHGVSERVYITNMINDALTIHYYALEKAQIDIKREYLTNQTILVDKVKLIQVLINLIGNAYDALIVVKKSNKELLVRAEYSNDKIVVSINDNGTGICAENLVKVFNYGFTTKKTGHGFGLHSCALAAKEMGGCLKVVSDGVDMGASFILELPFEPVKSE